MLGVCLVVEAIQRVRSRSLGTCPVLWLLGFLFVEVGDSHAPRPYKFMGLGEIQGPKAYKSIERGNVHGPKAYKFTGFGDIARVRYCGSWVFSL